MKKLLIVMAVLLSVSATLTAQDQGAARKKHFNLDNNIAIQGYDPVSYFQGKPVKGSRENALSHQGIVYYFSTPANKEAFKKDPSKYEPEYGGWCAYAMGEKGEKVSVDPRTYKIIDGKLYLFYNKFFNNTLTDWNKDETNLKKKADINWNKTVIK